MKFFQIEDEGGEKVTIRNVPVFRTHTDRDYICDGSWLDRCVADFVAQKAEATRLGGDKYAMLPPITIGHTPEDADAPEPPCVGFVDNLRRSGDFLFCDFVDVDRSIWLELKANRWPYRSAEIIPKRHRLTNVSLLGGRYPHFPLPVMRFSAIGRNGQREEIARYTLKGDATMTEEQMGLLAVLTPAQIKELAEAVAPLVARLLASGNGPQNPGMDLAKKAAGYVDSAQPTRYGLGREVLELGEMLGGDDHPETERYHDEDDDVERYASESNELGLSRDDMLMAAFLG